MKAYAVDTSAWGGYCYSIEVSLFFSRCCADHRDLHCVRHSFPTRRSSDLHSTCCRRFSETGARTRSKSTRSRPRSEEHTSELQSPDTISYAVSCLQKQK